MQIAETARIPLQQFPQRAHVSQSRQTSDVSREERLQLLNERMQSRKTGVAADTYSERAQLLSGAGSFNNSWIA
jgi:hypothetical protein